MMFGDQLSQAVLGLWVDLAGRHGYQSQLEPLLQAPPAPVKQKPVREYPPNSAHRAGGVAGARPAPLAPSNRERQARHRQKSPQTAENSAGKNGNNSAKTPAAKPRPQPRSSPAEERAGRRAEAEQARLAKTTLAPWAQKLLGDPRINEVTLDDILVGLDDYFTVFRQLKRMSREAYRFFSRVGAPLCLANTCIWVDDFESSVAIAAPEAMPSFFGMFAPRQRDQHRREWLENDSEPSLLEFIFFEKLKGNHAAAASPDTTVFRQHSIALGHRHWFSPAELKRFPGAREDWGVYWYVGVKPDRSVKALPCRMTRWQELPSGDGVEHSLFEVPRGLVNFAKPNGGDVDRFTRQYFNACVAFTASAISGLQVTIRKDGLAARIAIPIGAAKTFFPDRVVVDGKRRAPILHLRGPHERHLADGRVVPVGEYLAGSRFFQWHGYDISIGVPGIHYPAMEGLTSPLIDVSEMPEFDRNKLIPVDVAGKRYSREVWDHRRSTKFRGGAPERRYSISKLPDPPPDGRVPERTEEGVLDQLGVV